MWRAVSHLLIDAVIVAVSGAIIIGICIALSTSRIRGIIRSKRQDTSGPPPVNPLRQKS